MRQKFAIVSFRERRAAPSILLSRCPEPVLQPGEAWLHSSRRYALSWRRVLARSGRRLALSSSVRKPKLRDLLNPIVSGLDHFFQGRTQPLFRPALSGIQGQPLANPSVIGSSWPVRDCHRPQRACESAAVDAKGMTVCGGGSPRERNTLAPPRASSQCTRGSAFRPLSARRCSTWRPMGAPQRW